MVPPVPSIQVRENNLQSLMSEFEQLRSALTPEAAARVESLITRSFAAGERSKELLASCTLLTLTADPLQNIFRNFTLNDVIACASTCKTMEKNIKENCPNWWKELCKKEHVFQDQALSPYINYKNHNIVLNLARGIYASTSFKVASLEKTVSTIADGKLFFFCKKGNDGQCGILDIEKRELVANPAILDMYKYYMPSNPLSIASFNGQLFWGFPELKSYGASSLTRIEVTDCEGKKLLTLKTSIAPDHLIFLNDKLIVGSRTQPEIHILDSKTGDLLRKFKGHEKGISCSTIWDKKLITGSSDGCIKIWDPNTGEGVTLESSDSVLCLTTTLDGNVISGSKKGEINIWDLKDSKLIHTFKANHEINFLTVIGDVVVAVKTSYGGTCSCWSLHSGESLGDFKMDSWNLMGAKGGVLFMAASQDTSQNWGEVKILDFGATHNRVVEEIASLLTTPSPYNANQNEADDRFRRLPKNKQKEVILGSMTMDDGKPVTDQFNSFQAGRRGELMQKYLSALVQLDKSLQSNF